MVNYQGPQVLRGMMDAMEVPIFNRVHEINYRFKDLSKIPLDGDDVAKLHELEQISISKRRTRWLTEPEAKVVTGMVPPCRLAHVEHEENQMKLKVSAGSRLLCCPE